MKKHKTMKFVLTFFLIVFTNTVMYSQVTMNENNFLFSQSFSKEIALYNAKSFLFNNVLGSTTGIVKFEVIPLAAAASGELTTLIYNCESKQREGMILGFYGDYWNKAGVVYKGFAFKNFDKIQAKEFLDKIQNAIDANSEYLQDDKDNNNIYFKYDDINVLISAPVGSYTIRLFWNNFDSSWENTAFEKSKRRFEKRIK
jgi:hypothetical protein